MKHINLTWVVITQKMEFLIVRVKCLHLPEGQTGNAWEPSKPMLNSVPPPCSISHCHSLLLSS
jgi:hypothetical protein